MSDNNSWNAGISGQAPGAYTDLNSYTAGKSIRDMTQAELSRQNAPFGGADSTYPSTPGWTTSPGGSAFRPHVSNDPSSPLCAMRKSLFSGVLLSIFGGPLGLFYSSKMGALILLAGVAIATAYSGPESVAIIWPLGSLASIIWTIFAVNAYNGKAQATDAANLAAWKASQGASPT